MSYSVEGHMDEAFPPSRILLTPGPSALDARVYRALAAPLVGHMDPWFTDMMSDLPVLLRAAFQTRNKITFPISASGSGGIEAAVTNVLEDGDECIICVNGAFSERMALVAERLPVKVTRVEAPYGRTVDPQDVLRAGKGRKIKFVGLTHGETSSAVVQDLDAYRKVADELDALLVVDAVATFCGVPMNVDAQRIDVCFSGSQKALSAPPGMSPITVNERVERLLEARKHPVRSWYFDLGHTMSYWGKERMYHHTPPIQLIYGMREALRIVLEEGLEARWARHTENQQALIAGVEALGLELFVRTPKDRLATVTGVLIPQGVDDARLRRQLLDEFNIEIAGGLGPMKGKMWRIGLMGHSARKNNVLLFLAGMEKLLSDQGFRAVTGAGVAAAERVYHPVPQPALVEARK